MVFVQYVAMQTLSNELDFNGSHFHGAYIHIPQRPKAHMGNSFAKWEPRPWGHLGVA